MKTLGRIKLNKLNREELDKREMKSLVGGTQDCGCGCNYEGYNGSSIQANLEANVKGGKPYSGGGNLLCTSVDSNGNAHYVAAF